MCSRGNIKGTSSHEKWFQMEALSWRLKERISDLENLNEHRIHKIKRIDRFNICNSKGRCTWRGKIEFKCSEIQNGISVF